MRLNFHEIRINSQVQKKTGSNADALLEATLSDIKLDQETVKQVPGGFRPSSRVCVELQPEVGV